MLCFKLSLLLYFYVYSPVSVEAQVSAPSWYQVKVQFDLVSKPDWKPEVIDEFKKYISDKIDDLCNVNMTYCGITSTSEFIPENVLIEEGYPKVKDVNSIMLFAVNIPKSGRDVNRNIYVKKSALVDVVKENRKEIQEVLITAANEPYEASFRISYVDDDLVLEMSDQTLNSIIIPIVISVVILMTAIILSLEARKRWKMKQQVKKIVTKSGQKDRLLKV